MLAHLDLQKQSVVVGDRELPFAVDLRAGCVSLGIAGIDYRLRPLRWKEKRILARLATLNPDVLKREFVRAVLLEPETPPATGENLDALFELGKWLNQPEGRGVRFDPAVVAAATVELTRFTGLPPGSFDQLDAADVELMWQAAQNSANQVGNTEAPPTNRIIIVRDDKTGVPSPRRKLSTESPPAIAPTSGGISVGEAKGDASADKTPAEAPASAVESSSPLAKPAAESEPTKPVNPGRRLATQPQFRATAWQRRPVAARRQEQITAREILSVPAAAHENAQQRRAFSTSSAPANSPPARFESTSEREAPVWPHSHASAPVPSPTVDARTTFPSLHHREIAVAELPARREGSNVDTDSMLDEFAELLTQAAAQLGIDVES